MMAKEKNFCCPTCKFALLSNASRSCLCCRSLAFPRREKFIFSLVGEGGGLRKGKFIHPSDAEESSLFLPPFSLPWRSLIRKGGRLRLETCFCFLLRPFSRQRRRGKEEGGEVSKLCEKRGKRNFSLAGGGGGRWKGREESWSG